MEIINVVTEFIDTQFKCDLSYKWQLAIMCDPLYCIIDPLINAASHECWNAVDWTEIVSLISSYRKWRPWICCHAVNSCEIRE